MPSKKQIAWRKKFAKMAKAGKFRGNKGSKARTKMVKTSPNVKAYHSKKKKGTPKKKGSALKHSAGYDSKEWRS